MKNSKIKSITFKNQFTSNFGELFAHAIELENGDKGDINAKEKLPAKLAVGAELWYTVTTGQHGTKIKSEKAPEGAETNNGGNGANSSAKSWPTEKDKMIGFAMAYAKDLAVAGKIEITEIEGQFEVLYNKMISKLS